MSAIAQARGIVVDNGALTAIKWLALALMVVDHLDAFVYGRTLGWATDLGRLVMPLFAFVLAYNLARSDALASGMHRRVLGRLAVFGILATPFHAGLRGDLLPLNIMATLATATAVIWAIERREWTLAALVFVVGGAVSEYWWPGVGLVVVTWLFLRAPSAGGLVAVGLALAGLAVGNGSHAALWAAPVALLASRLDLALPRCKWTFWAFYPVHLAAFWIWNSGI